MASMTILNLKEKRVKLDLLQVDYLAELAAIQLSRLKMEWMKMIDG
jgi:hypothetical protein